MVTITTTVRTPIMHLRQRDGTYGFIYRCDNGERVWLEDDKSMAEENK